MSAEAGSLPPPTGLPPPPSPSLLAHKKKDRKRASSSTAGIPPVKRVAGAKRSRDDMEQHDDEKDKRRRTEDDGKQPSGELEVAPEDGSAGTAKADPEQPDAASAAAAATPEAEWQVVGRRTKKKAKKIPKKDSGNYPSIIFGQTARLQAKIQVSDLRNLVTYIFADGTAPQWVAVSHRPSFRKIVAIMVPGLDEAMFREDVDFARLAREEDGSVEALEKWSKSSSSSGSAGGNVPAPEDCHPRDLDKARLAPAVQPLADVFAQIWPVRARAQERAPTLYLPENTFLLAPWPKSVEKKLSGGGSGGNGPSGYPDERTRITDFLVSYDEYLDNGFELHPAMLVDAQQSAFVPRPGWVYTAVASLEEGDVPEAAIEHGSVTAGRTIYSIDCEMCRTDDGELSLARLSVVDWDGRTVLDELVKPARPITDYLTPYSGITEALLAPVTTTLQDMQQRLLQLIDARTLLVGHSLDSDLRTLRLAHPFIVDTSVLFTHPAGPPHKHKLRWLASKFLARQIQCGDGTAAGHNSVEDARACIDLMRKKCEKGRHWGVAELGRGGEGVGESLFDRLGRSGMAYRAQGGPQAKGGLPTGKSAAAVEWAQTGARRRDALTASAAHVLDDCRSDADVEAAVLRAVRGDADGLEVPGGGVDFVWARMRQLEAVQGWWRSGGGGAGARRQSSGAASSRSRDEGGAETDGSAPSLEELREMLKKDEEGEEEGEKKDEKEEKEEKEEKDEDGKDGQSPSDLERATSALARRLRRIHNALPPCTVLLVFSGGGDPRSLQRLLAQRAQHRREYHTPGKKWDDISVPWSDTEDQQLRRALRRARDGVGFMTVK